VLNDNAAVMVDLAQQFKEIIAASRKAANYIGCVPHNEAIPSTTQ
jgi:hypothetical protein